MSAALALLVTLLKAFEGCRLRAYRDIVNVLTICYGSTKGVTEGMVKTQSECEALLARESAAFMLRVLKLCPSLIRYPHRLAACTSMAYNCGLGSFQASTLRRKCQRGAWASAGPEFDKWNRAGGRIVRGLVLRRAAERRVFEAEAA